MRPETEMTINKPRKWWIAGLMSLSCPGLGQVYNGQGRKGILFLLLMPLVALPSWAWSLHSDTFSLLSFAHVLLQNALYIVAPIDAIAAARRRRSNYTLKGYNKVIIYSAILALALGVSTALTLYMRANIWQAFSIPAGSMKPTLLVGDHILVDRRPSARIPQRGAIVVFEYPLDPAKDFVKRMVAVAGDTVEIRDKRLLVNGAPVEEPYIVHTYSAVATAGPARQRDNIGPLQVPANACFVLGDNRDESYDSRFWGFVDQSKILGTVRTVYWSWDRENGCVRWNRIGMAITP